MPRESGKKKSFLQQSESGQGDARWTDGIAIIGMSARFPRSRSIREFWERLLAGELLISDLTSEDLRKAGVEQETFATPDYVHRGNTIEDADSLDAELFGLSRRDAEIMDPQHRVFLECAWEAMEHAGYTGDGERVGVFAGVGMNTYMLLLLSNPAVLASAGGYQLMLANDKDFLATRVAYKLNLRGPAVAVQTACSTSLAAVHLACQSILAGECAMALAGGVSIPFPQGVGYSYTPGMILSPDGYCRPFDAAARGTVPGRGAGVVVLKKLSQALADEDLIYAVIRGSAWNNDGSGKIGYTAPSIDGQADVIRKALAAAGVTPDRIGYVEAHGTATELGDPIEVAALTTVFAESDARTASCVLGAVKANMGHADVAAGVAGLMKAALATQTGIIPPTPNFQRANPALSLDSGPFVVSATTQPWPDHHSGERWAGVSSFGIGGTNVHVVLSSAPERAIHPATSQSRVFPVSARTATALAAACDRLADHLESDPSLAAEDVASTLQLGRREFSRRRAFVAHDGAELATLLRKPPKHLEDTPRQLARDVVFLFPGQGQQFVGMTEALYNGDSIFRKTIDDGAALLRDEFDINAIDFVAGVDKSPALTEQIRGTAIAQPILFLLEYALAARWRGLGVEPCALLGHSLGELTAAAVSGVFSFEDGLRLAAERGRLMAQTPPGIMLAVMLHPAKLADYMNHDVWLAVENAPKMSVASGTIEAMEKLERRLAEHRIAAVRLASRNAFHTPLMAEAARAFRQRVEGVTRHAPTIPWLSNVSGTWVDSDDAQSPQYWGNQILARVRFTQNLSALAERDRLLLEVGPGDALISIARHQMPRSVTMASLGAENRRKSDHEIFLDAAARAWECGVRISWSALEPGSRARRVPLPTYPFERQCYWIESAAPGDNRAPAAVPRRDDRLETLQSIKRNDIASWFYAPSWHSTPPASVALQSSSDKLECWLVLLDRSGLGEAVADGLRQKGREVIAVRAGEEFVPKDGNFSVNPAKPSDYQQLWQGIADRKLRPTGLVNLWTLSGMGVDAYNSLVFLLQAARTHRQRFRRIEIITDRLESVSGEFINDVQRAEVLGLARVIPTEYAGTQCRCIDVQLPEGVIGQVAEQLLVEIDVPGSGMNIAYRQNIRWQKGWTPAPLRMSSETIFRRGGIYLITGGIGGLGYSIARYLLQHYQACVVLTGRTVLPPRNDWARWLNEHDKDDPVSRRILRMQELEKSGGSVRYASAEVSSKEAMTDIFAEAHAHFGKIEGVFHAAGLPDGSMIASQQIEAAAAVRRPKVQGSMVLAELLQAEKPDFFILFSSISAFFPVPGQGAYAAANTFQNYFADYCRKVLKLPAVAIGFDAWQEAGMAAEMVLPDGFEAVKEDRLRTAMNTFEGIEVIRRVLTNWRDAQILTTTVNIEKLLGRKTPDFAHEESHDTPLPSHDVELAAILEIWRELLGAETITPSDNFFEIGGHSLMGTMVAARLRERFGVVLTLRTLFEAPTPQALAEVVRAARSEAWAEPILMTVPADEREEFEI
jgi:phthiocerol/phenolphthiocerol synthesis type-I polyketide synthase E